MDAVDGSRPCLMFGLAVKAERAIKYNWVHAGASCVETVWCAEGKGPGILRGLALPALAGLAHSLRMQWKMLFAGSAAPWPHGS